MSYNDAKNPTGYCDFRSGFGLLDEGIDLATMRDRARALERNNAIARSILDRCVENFIGTGIKLRPTTSSGEFNAEVEGVWKYYSSGQRLDVRRLFSFDDLQRLICRSILRDGDVAILLLKINGIPQLQLIESDLIEQPYATSFTIQDGIEWGPNGQPVAFWIRVYDEMGTVTHQRVEARNVIYLANHVRASRTRGLTTYAGSFDMHNNFAGFIGATVKSARVQAGSAIIAKAKNTQQAWTRNQGKVTETDADGNTFRTIPIEGGAVNVIPDTEDMIPFSPSQPGPFIDQAVSTLGRFLGLAFGMPYDDIFLDFSKSNFSNSRMRRIAMNVTVDVFQQMLKTAFFDRFWPWFVSSIVKAGMVKTPEPRDSWSYDWTPNARPSNDLQKDATAWELMDRLGVITPQEIVESMGTDWKTHVETLRANREQLKGLLPSRQAPAPGAGGEKSQPEPEDAQDTGASNAA